MSEAREGRALRSAERVGPARGFVTPTAEGASPKTSPPMASARSSKPRRVPGLADVRTCRWVPALLIALAGPAAGQEGPIRLEGLVVTGSPTPRPFTSVSTHVTVLEGDELRAQGVSLVQDALRAVPGVDVVQNGSFGSVTSVFMRGGESDYVLVLIDGVQVNQPGGAFDFSGLTMAGVERIEVVRGPSSALFGSDAVAGVIHVITSRGAGAPTGSVEVLGGSFSRLDATVTTSGSSTRSGYSVSLTRRGTSGLHELNNSSRNTVFSGSMRFQPDGSTDGRLTLRLSDRRYHYPTEGSGVAGDRNSFNYEDGLVVGLSLARDVTDRLQVRGTIGLSGSDGGTDDAPDGPADTLGFFGFTSLDHVRRASADVRTSFRLGGGMVTLGGELEEERQRSFTESLSEYGTSSGRSEYARWNRAGFLSASLDMDRVALNAGARLEDNERFGRLATWELGGAVPLWGGQTRLRGSLGRGIKEPTFFENHATGFATGNPDLRPERSLGWEMGVERDLARGRLAATYFAQTFEDLIQYTATPAAEGDPNFYNVAEARSRGVELAADARLRGWTLSAAWTWLDTRVTNAGFESGPGASFVEGGRLLRRPERSGSARVAYAWMRGTLSVNLLHVGSREDRDFSQFPAGAVRLPAYSIISVGGQLRLTERLVVTVRGENLGNRDYEEVYGFSAPGRGVYAGLRFGVGGVR